MKTDPPTPRRTAGQLLLVAVWLGIVTGLVEGAGLLLFQRVNWERWGPIYHTTWQILWISPIVDTIFLACLALLITMPAWRAPRFPALRVAVSVFSGIAVCDWMTLTGRLSHRACLLLGIGVGVAFGRWFSRHSESTIRFWKRSFPAVLAAGVMTFAGIQAADWLAERNTLARLPAAGPGAPNVLVIVVDTLRADHLSSYGYSRPTSPNIDRLAREGVLFENAVAVTSWTFPSHVSLVTGEYPFEHGIGNVREDLIGRANPSSLGGAPVIGEAMEGLGYRTAAFSANHTFFTSNLGFGRGFSRFEDYFFSIGDRFARTELGQEVMRKYCDRDVLSALRRLGLPDWFDLDHPQDEYVVPDIILRTRADRVNERLLRWMDDGPREHPFFAFVNYYDVHSPYGAPRGYPAPGWPLERAVDRYDASVKYVDDSIGQLMGELERRGLARNTLVVVTGDHGESLGEHGLRYHGEALYWGLIHVPLIFWYPGHVPAGKRVAAAVTNASLPATLMSVAGGEESEFPLPSLETLWLHPETMHTWPDPLSELDRQRLWRGPKEQELVPNSLRGPMKSLISGRWQLITHKQLGDQIYDWVKDPEETDNLMGTPEGRSAALSITSRLRDVLAGMTPEQRERRLTAAELLTLHSANGSHTVHDVHLTKAVNDYYRVAAAPGSTLAISVVSDDPAGRPFDPILVIEDPQGNLAGTCRNPGDDHLPPPGKADTTPDAFDDFCLSDDVGPKDSNSELELRTPGSSGADVEYYLRVATWDGRAGADTKYQLIVRSTQ